VRGRAPGGPTTPPAAALVFIPSGTAVVLVCTYGEAEPFK